VIIRCNARRCQNTCLSLTEGPAPLPDPPARKPLSVPTARLPGGRAGQPAQAPTCLAACPQRLAGLAAWLHDCPQRGKSSKQGPAPDMTVLDTPSACMIMVATVDGHDHCIEQLRVFSLLQPWGARAPVVDCIEAHVFSQCAAVSYECWDNDTLLGLN
jgi:hypothetical protein